MSPESTAPESERSLQEQIIAFIRAFGLHRPDQTPCGEPVAVAEAHALMELTYHDGLSQIALAQRLQLEKSTVSRLVSMLERKQWISRSRSPIDGRVLEVRLTREGRSVAAQLARARQAKFARVLAALPEERRAPVIEALRALVEAIHESQ